MFNYFIEKYQIKEIVSVSNRSYQEDYQVKLNFIIKEKTQPNQYFIQDFMRFESNTENEIKIFDSGNLIYIFNI